MSYVVNWRTADGTAGWHAAAELAEATAHVEHLRNDDGVDGAKIFRLEAVPFEFKPYFRVELAGATAAPVTPAPAAATATESWADAKWPEPAPATEAPAAVPAEPEAALEPAESASNGVPRRGLFGR